MMSHKNKSKRVAVALITDHNDDILMGVRNDCGKWTNPAGHIEIGEDPYEGCIREVKEETNIDVEDIKLVKAKFFKDTNTLVYLFKVVPDSKSFITSENDPDKEVDSWHYMDPNDIKDELHVPLERNIALQYWIKN